MLLLLLLFYYFYFCLLFLLGQVERTDSLEMISSRLGGGGLQVATGLVQSSFYFVYEYDLNVIHDVCQCPA